MPETSGQKRPTFRAQMGNVSVDFPSALGIVQERIGVAIGGNKNTSYCHPFLSVYQQLTPRMADMALN